VGGQDEVCHFYSLFPSLSFPLQHLKCLMRTPDEVSFCSRQTRERVFWSFEGERGDRVGGVSGYVFFHQMPSSPKTQKLLSIQKFILDMNISAPTFPATLMSVRLQTEMMLPPRSRPLGKSSALGRRREQPWSKQVRIIRETTTS
jgi:hypothetical protein